MVESANPTPAAPLPPLVKIGDLARLANVTPRTLRFYEDLGLIRPEGRSQGGFRLYGAGQVDRLRAVQALKEVGFSLEDIRAYRDLADENHVAFEVMARLRARLVDGKKHLEARIARLETALADLERSEKVLAACTGCEAKRYDADCHRCWTELAGGELPDALKAVT
jgi:DNA-binding transcriptional MerR regulator